jgi:hypothetical protein
MSNARGFRHRSKERRLSSATRTNPTRRTTAGAGLSKLRAGPADTSQIARSMLHRYVQAAALRCTNSLSFVPQQPWQVEAQCCAVDRIESQHSAALTLAHRELATLRPSSSAYACTHQAETISVSAHVIECASGWLRSTAYRRTTSSKQRACGPTMRRCRGMRAAVMNRPKPYCLYCAR